MGTIIPRKRKSGTTAFLVQVQKKRNGVIVHREARTFSKKGEARAWMARREAELDEPGALDRVDAPAFTLADAIDRYLATSRKAIGRTKSQVLGAIRQDLIAGCECGAIRSADLVAFAERLSKSRQPQTVANYISHLASIFRIAKPAWGMPLSYDAMTDAQAALRHQGIVAKSNERTRRPSLDELDKLMTHFTERSKRAPSSAPMAHIIAFAIFSTRRQEEITRIAWEDFDALHKRLLVRDMKHPGQKVGNDVWVELIDEALAIIGGMPRKGPRIFPYSTDAISSAFTRACKMLEIEDLHFHDLRHEGISRLFEMGRTIPQAASVSGHKSWQSLQRYAHLRQVGDKFAGWPWFARIGVKL